MQTQKKTYLLPQDLIEEMKKTFGTKTETEAIIRAMKEVSFKSHLIKWHVKNSGRMKIQNFHGR